MRPHSDSPVTREAFKAGLTVFSQKRPNGKIYYRFFQEPSSATFDNEAGSIFTARGGAEAMVFLHGFRAGLASADSKFVKLY